MKVILLLATILIAGLVIFFVTRSKDNYTLNGTTYPPNNLKNKNSVKRKIKKFKIITDPKILSFRQKYYENLLKTQSKNLLKKNKYNSQPSASKAQLGASKGLLGASKWTPEEIRKAKADKEIDEYITGMDDAQSAAVGSILTALYGIYECKNSDDPNCKKNALLNLALRVGVACLEIGLACMGLGFINTFIDGFMDGPGPNQIDYDRIAAMISDAETKSSIDDFGRKVNTRNDNIHDFLRNYASDKAYCQAACFPSDIAPTNKDIIDCMKNPNLYNPNTKFDSGLIIQKVGTIGDFDNKRAFLNYELANSDLGKIVNNQDVYGINGCIEYGKLNPYAGVSLYYFFKLFIGYTITYYQEKACISQETPTDNDDYVNPWLSKFLGNLSLVGRQQPGGSLLGELQILCQKLFDYLVLLYKNYWNGLTYIGKSGVGKDCWGTWSTSGNKWMTFTDNNKVVTQDWWDIMNDTNPLHYTDGNIIKYGDVVDNLQVCNNDDYTYRFRHMREQYMYCFDMYMNNPFEKLFVLKNMAGIFRLKGEDSFFIYDPITPNGLENKTSYTDNGGYPFGSGKKSYREVRDIYDQYMNNPSADGNLTDNAVLATMCTPPIEEQITCSTNYSGNFTKPFDSSVFNLKGDDTTYEGTMVCPKNYSAVSCLKTLKTAGNKNGDFTKNSRTAYCYNQNTNDVLPLIPGTGDGKCSSGMIRIIFSIDIPNQEYLVYYFTDFDYGQEMPGFTGNWSRPTASNILGIENENIQCDFSWIPKLIKTNYPDSGFPEVTQQVTLNVRVQPDLRPDQMTNPPITVDAYVTSYPIQIINIDYEYSDAVQKRVYLMTFRIRQLD